MSVNLSLEYGIFFRELTPKNMNKVAALDNLKKEYWYNSGAILFCLLVTSYFNPLPFAFATGINLLAQHQEVNGRINRIQFVSDYYEQDEITDNQLKEFLQENSNSMEKFRNVRTVSRTFILLATPFILFRGLRAPIAKTKEIVQKATK